MSSEDKQFIKNYKDDVEQSKKLSVMDAPTVKESTPDATSELTAYTRKLEAQVASLMIAIEPFAEAANMGDELRRSLYPTGMFSFLNESQLLAAKAAYDTVKRELE